VHSDQVFIYIIFCFFNPHLPHRPIHALEDCHVLRWKPYQESIKFLSTRRLCFGCLPDKHVARDCPERKVCKITNCTRRHPTVLHTPSREKPTVDIGVGTDRTDDIPRVLNAMVNTDEFPNEVAREVHSKTAMAIIPVKVRSRATNKAIVTYAFLDSRSSASFCTVFDEKTWS